MKRIFLLALATCLSCAHAPPKDDGWTTSPSDTSTVVVHVDPSLPQWQNTPLDAKKDGGK